MEKGTALKSYGVYAAKLAGLPKPVVRRAEELLIEYESENSESFQNISDETETELEVKLSEIDTDALSPVEALMKIYELQKLLPKRKNKNLKKAVS